MHKSKYFLENETFDIQTDRQIPIRRPDLEVIKKERENLLSSIFCRPYGPQSKNNCDTSCIGGLGTVPRGLEKGIKRGGNRGKNEYHSNYDIVLARILRMVLETRG